MAYQINLEGCINCGWCRRTCPTDTIRYFTTHHRTHVIEPEGCIDCDLCAQACPVDCIAKDTTYVHDPAELAAAKQKAKAWARTRYNAQQTRRTAAAQLAQKLAAIRQ